MNGAEVGRACSMCDGELRNFFFGVGGNVKE